MIRRSAERGSGGIVTLMLSVRLSVCNVDVPSSSTLGQFESNISLGSSLLGAPTSASRETPYISRGIAGGVAVCNRKPAMSLKRVKIGPSLLLTIDRKLHVTFRLVPKSTTDILRLMRFRDPPRKYE